MHDEHETIDLATYRRLTCGARGKKAPRADRGRARAAERCGLTALLRRGWSLVGNDAYQRLYKIGDETMDTGPRADLAAACKRAKELER